MLCLNLYRLIRHPTLQKEIEQSISLIYLIQVSSRLEYLYSVLKIMLNTKTRFKLLKLSSLGHGNHHFVFQQKPIVNSQYLNVFK